MNILTWNIQATKGCDGRFDLNRIVSHIKQYGELDIICLQEISRNIPDLNSDDQSTLIAEYFPNHAPVWGPGFSAPNAQSNNSEFGNLTLARRRLLVNSRVHILPSPAVKELQMTRTMVETIIRTDASVAADNISLFNTHLAFHSSMERVQQLQRLTQLRDQVMTKAGSDLASGLWGPYNYEHSCSAVILCGDLNTGLDTDEYNDHIANRQWVDCWTAQPDAGAGTHKKRLPTCGCFDSSQWPEGAHTRDFFLASDNISDKVVRVDVDVDVDASDHQPVFMEISL